VLIVLSFLMLPLNMVIPGRGHALNFAIDFRGGTEMRVDFSREISPSEVRDAMETGGYKDSEVVPLPEFKNAFLVRFPAVSALQPEQVKQAEAALRGKLGQEALRKFEFSDGGDKAYVKLDKSKSVEPAQIDEILRSVNIKSNQVQRFGRPEDNTFEVVLVGLDREVRAALDSKLGQGAVSAIPSVGSVGAKAGKELRDNGIISLLAAIGFIMLYILVRFDFRYGPGTVIALLHDAIFVLGAFALTYKEFSLTTIAAILTVIGYSMNDTIVVFDRIRENASKMRDKKFTQIVNLSVNETLSRTILTSATVFFVTLAMNIWGTGTIRDFAFAMNVGVIVGTYSSIFVASPVLIWLNEKSVAMQKKSASRTGRSSSTPT
jgi:preprotein translocase subunit SecF